MPPLVGVAVNVKIPPLQMGPLGLALILNDGVTLGFTTSVILSDVAVLGIAQEALLVKIQDTTSPLFSVLLLYVPVSLPMLLPFTFH